MLSNELALMRLRNIKQNLIMARNPAVGYEPHHIQELIDLFDYIQEKAAIHAKLEETQTEIIKVIDAELVKVRKWNDNQRELIESLRSKPDGVWPEIVKLLNALYGDRSWLDIGDTGLEAAKNIITIWYDKAEKFDDLVENISDALDEATEDSSDEIRSEDDPISACIFFDEMSKLYPTRNIR